MYSSKELLARAQAYCNQHGLHLLKSLGHGMQGIVYSASRTKEVHESAIKVHSQKAAYLRERDVYLRLSENNATRIRGLAIPRLLGTDDNLLIIEMALVHPPFIVDFGGAYLDEPPAHSVDPLTKQNWIEEKREQFGENWEKAQAILIDLEEKYDIYVVDVNPGNIQFKHPSTRKG